jgi:hypothetical protein
MWLSSSKNQKSVYPTTFSINKRHLNELQKDVQQSWGVQSSELTTMES